MSSVAAQLAADSVDNLAASHVVIVGSGDMAELAVEALRHRGAQQITVVNRTHDRAAQLAQRWNATALTFERLSEALAQADIVITSTGAPHIVIKPDLVQAVAATRPDRPLTFIDIAVPRDVDPAIGHIPHVACYDIDDLETRLNGSLAERRQEAPRVEAIVTEETFKFMAYLHNLDIVPVISDLRAKADAIRRAEIEKTFRHLSHLGETDRKRIEVLTESLVNKLLHDPTLRLKAEASNGHAAEYAAATGDLDGPPFRGGDGHLSQRSLLGSKQCLIGRSRRHFRRGGCLGLLPQVECKAGQSRQQQERDPGGFTDHASASRPARQPVGDARRNHEPWDQEYRPEKDHQPLHLGGNVERTLSGLVRGDLDQVLLLCGPIHRVDEDVAVAIQVKILVRGERAVAEDHDTALARRVLA